MNSARVDLGRGRDFTSAVLYVMCTCGSKSFLSYNYTEAKLELVSRANSSAL